MVRGWTVAKKSVCKAWIAVLIACSLEHPMGWYMFLERRRKGWTGSVANEPAIEPPRMMMVGLVAQFDSGQATKP